MNAIVDENSSVGELHECLSLLFLALILFCFWFRVDLEWLVEFHEVLKVFVISGFGIEEGGRRRGSR